MYVLRVLLTESHGSGRLGASVSCSRHIRNDHHVQHLLNVPDGISDTPFSFEEMVTLVARCYPTHLALSHISLHFYFSLSSLTRSLYIDCTAQLSTTHLHL